MAAPPLTELARKWKQTHHRLIQRWSGRQRQIFCHPHPLARPLDARFGNRGQKLLLQPRLLEPMALVTQVQIRQLKVAHAAVAGSGWMLMQLSDNLIDAARSDELLKQISLQEAVFDAKARLVNLLNETPASDLLDMILPTWCGKRVARPGI